MERAGGARGKCARRIDQVRGGGVLGGKGGGCVARGGSGAGAREGEKATRPPRRPRSIPRYERRKDLFLLGAVGRGSETPRGLFPNSCASLPCSSRVPCTFRFLSRNARRSLARRRYFFRILPERPNRSDRARVCLRQRIKTARCPASESEKSGKPKETGGEGPREGER